MLLVTKTMRLRHYKGLLYQAIAMVLKLLNLFENQMLEKHFFFVSIGPWSK